MTVTNVRPLRTYPLLSPEADPRFDAGLVEVVALVLEERGYPMIHEGRDFDALAEALHGFLYRPTVHHSDEWD